MTPVARKLPFLVVAAALAFGLLVPRMALAGQGQGTLTGTVIDAATKQPLGDVTVSATSPALQGVQTVFTDGSGTYRIPNLPPGDYAVVLDLDGYRPYGLGGIHLAADSTIRLNAQLLPTTLRAEEVTVVGDAPTVDVGSGATGRNIDKDFLSHVPIVLPGSKGSQARSFESVADTTPGASADAYGTSINGTTSPENSYVIDGVSVNDPAYGILGTPLSIDFIEEVNVISGGYMPEYGRSTGGVMNVVTKSGSNDFHGSVFTYITPGALEGPREKVRANGQTIGRDTSLVSINDFGFDIGGPILQDQLWFYAGFDVAFSRYKVVRSLNKARLDANLDQAFEEEDGIRYNLVDPIPGTEQAWYATERAYQYIGKLTYAINQDHSLSLTVYGAPTFAGGPGDLGIDQQVDVADSGPLFGSVETNRLMYTAFANDLALKYSGAFENKTWLVDASFGWHYQHAGRKPTDGSQPGDESGLAGLASVLYRRTSGGPHSITDFERPDLAAECAAPAGSSLTTLCPVDSYFYGGPDFIDDSILNRFQGRGVMTHLTEGAGHHVIKAGLDIEGMTYEHTKAYSGWARFRETLSGNYFSDNRMYGFLDGPDSAVVTDPQVASSTSTTIGAFLQDSWAIMDLVTLNVGLRYDAQMLFGDDGKLGLSLPQEWSPRAGLVWDFTQEGKSRLFANFAMFYENVPLDMVDRSFPGERQILSYHDAATCDPRDPAQQKGACRDPAGLVPINSAADPNQLWIVTGGDKVPVDPDIKPQSSSEFVLGAEYEAFPKGVIGISYTRRWMNNVIEDMSRDEGQTYFIGNPGSGIASDFPEATRTYDGMNIYFDKKFAGDELVQWLVSASYTVSYLRGNWAGLFRPETGQLDPNINSDFDLVSLLPNRDGALPGDKRHQIKLYGATQFTPEDFLVDIGVGFRTGSGEPTNYLGGHELYGDSEVFILPRGAGERLPWVSRFDSHLGFGMRLGGESTMVLTMDVFNLFGFQTTTSTDEDYTYGSVLPVVDGGAGDLCKPNETCNGSKLKYADGSDFDPADINPNFGRTTSHQSPRQFRFGLKATF